jgi:hypothetical protein
MLFYIAEDQARRGKMLRFPHTLSTPHTPLRRLFECSPLPSILLSVFLSLLSPSRTHFFHPASSSDLSFFYGSFTNLCPTFALSSV